MPFLFSAARPFLFFALLWLAGCGARSRAPGTPSSVAAPEASDPIVGAQTSDLSVRAENSAAPMPTPVSAAPTPTLISAGTMGDECVHLTWKALTGVKAFHIQYAEVINEKLGPWNNDVYYKLGNDTSIDVCYLTPGRRYAFRIDSFASAVDHSEFSNVKYATTLLPVQLTEVAKSATQCARVTWAGRTDTDGFIVQYTLKAEGPWANAPVTPKASDASANVCGLGIGQTTYFRVLALGAEGATAEPSNVSSFYLAPDTTPTPTPTVIPSPVPVPAKYLCKSSFNRYQYAGRTGPILRDRVGGAVSTDLNYARKTAHQHCMHEATHLLFPSIYFISCSPIGCAKVN